MGIQHWGAFGGFQNQTGPLVGHWTNGQNVITAIPHPSQKPATTAQLNMRAKFKTVVSFLRALTGLIRVGYQNAHKENQTAFNAAFMETYANAVVGVAPNYVIDYPKLLYSKGFLSGPYDWEVIIDAVAAVKFAWKANLGTGIGAPTDLATLMAYNDIKKEFVILTSAAPRSALTATLQLPPTFTGDEVYLYISFVSANGKMCSDSVYVGKYPVA